jgi:hypothetical protein
VICTCGTLVKYGDRRGDDQGEQGQRISPVAILEDDADQQNGAGHAEQEDLRQGGREVGNVCKVAVFMARS